MKEIPLSRGLVAKIDDADYERANQYKWSAFGRKRVYAGRNDWSSGKSHTVMLHRFILSAPDGLFVDHIDHDTLNCQRTNMRLCSKLENNRNKLIYSNNTSGYKGVTWDAESGNWAAQTRVKGRSVKIGRFSDPLEAALAYDAKAKELFGDFAHLNFPEGAA